MRPSYIANQGRLVELLKQNFPLIVISDFVEKFSFVLEDAVQGFQWNNVLQFIPLLYTIQKKI